MRFTKDNMLDYLQERIERMESDFGFDPDRGWIQIDGSSDHIHRLRLILDAWTAGILYGEHRCLVELAETIECGLPGLTA